jgi:hypothetical protein
MAWWLDGEKNEILSENDLFIASRNSALTAVHSFYERAHQDCLSLTCVFRARQMQALVQVWKQLWTWR